MPSASAWNPVAKERFQAECSKCRSGIHRAGSCAARQPLPGPGQSSHLLHTAGGSGWIDRGVDVRGPHWERMPDRNPSIERGPRRRLWGGAQAIPAGAVTGGRVRDWTRVWILPDGRRGVIYGAHLCFLLSRDRRLRHRSDCSSDSPALSQHRRDICVTQVLTGRMDPRCLLHARFRRGEHVSRRDAAIAWKVAQSAPAGSNLLIFSLAIN